MITVPERAGKTVSAAIEDVRASPEESQLTTSIQESIDEVDFNLATEICDSKNNSDIPENNASHTVTENNQIIQKNQHSNDDSLGDFTECNLNDMQPDSDVPVAGDRISVFWPLDNKY